MDGSGVVAIIPARGGSKGLPRKNLKPIGGIPLVARSVIAAKSSSRITHVVVSTDDDEIAAVAQDYGACVVHRPKELADDLSSSESALLHALNSIEQGGILPSVLVFLQCTSPFTTGEQIDAVLAALDSSNINSSFSVNSWHGFLWDAAGAGVNHNPALPRKRRQELDPVYIETGAIYAMRTKAFRLSGSRFCAPWAPVPLSDSGPEIDTDFDLRLCHAFDASLKSY